MEEQYIIQLFQGICEAIKMMHTSHDPIAHRDITVYHMIMSCDLVVIHTANKYVAKQQQTKFNSHRSG